MSSFWVNNSILDGAFDDINTNIVSIDLSKYWGHFGSTLKVKVMTELTHVLSLPIGEQNNDVIKNLNLMLKECQKYTKCVFTSPSYTTLTIPTTHENDAFTFFDFEKRKVVEINKNKIEPFNKSFVPFKTRLMWEIQNGTLKNVIKLINKSKDCYPEMTYDGDTALMLLLKKYPNIVIVLLEKYGARCIVSKECNSPALYGIELKIAINNKFSEVALKLLGFYELEYLKTCTDINANTFLMLSILHKLPEVSFKLIELYGENYMANGTNNMDQTPLMLVCSTPYINEEIAIKMLTTFGPKNCFLEYKNNLGESAMTFAKNNNLNKFLKMVYDLEDIPDLEDTIDTTDTTDTADITDITNKQHFPIPNLLQVNQVQTIENIPMDHKNIIETMKPVTEIGNARPWNGNVTSEPNNKGITGGNTIPWYSNVTIDPVNTGIWPSYVTIKPGSKVDPVHPNQVHTTQAYINQVQANKVQANKVDVTQHINIPMNETINSPKNLNINKLHAVAQDETINGFKNLDINKLHVVAKNETITLVKPVNIENSVNDKVAIIYKGIEISSIEEALVQYNKIITNGSHSSEAKDFLKILNFFA